MNPEEIAHKVHKAVKGLGTDDNALIQAITSSTNAQLVAANMAYKSLHSHTMIEDIKGDTSGDYRDLLVGLCEPAAEYRAEVLHHAVAGLGTDDHALVDIIATASNAEVAIVTAAYNIRYGKDPRSDIAGDTSGHFRKALENVLEGKRNELLPYDPARVELDCHELHHKGEGRLGTDDDFFVNFFTKNPFPHIYAVDQLYKQKYGHDLKKACEKELSGNFCRLLQAMCTPRAEYWAHRIHHSVAGAGTNDKLLKRAFILLSPPELAQAGAAYAAIYGKPLAAAVENDTSGNYKKALAALLRRAGL